MLLVVRCKKKQLGDFSDRKKLKGKLVNDI